MATTEVHFSGDPPSPPAPASSVSSSWESYTDFPSSNQCRDDPCRSSDSSGTGIGHLEYSARKPPPPLTEAELRYYAALPPVYLQPPIYSWTPPVRTRSSPLQFTQQRVLFDEVHRKIIHQQVGCPPAALPSSLAAQLGPVERDLSPPSTVSEAGEPQAFPGQAPFLRAAAQSPASVVGGAHTPQAPGSCSFLVCVDARESHSNREREPTVVDLADTAKTKGSDAVIPFNKGLASILRFSPCGRYLLYVAPPTQPSSSSSTGAAAPACVSLSPGGAGARAEAGAAASGTETRPEVGLETLHEEVEIGVVDTVAPQAEPVVLLPLDGAGGGETGKDNRNGGGILQAFWLPSLVPAETEANICVITRQAVEIFTFVFEPPSVRRVRRLPQACSLAWAVLCPFPNASNSAFPAPVSGSSAAASRARGPTRSCIAGTRRPAVAGAFVLAVAARALQPFLLKWNENGTPGVTLAKLPKIELNLPQWQTLQQQEVHFLLVYGVVYCVHVDQAAGRISMRTLTGLLQPDIVLDCLQPGPMEVSVVDNLILVHHQRLRSTLIFDICDYPSLPTAPFSVSLSSSVSSSRAAKTVRAVTPLVHHSVVGNGPSPAFEESEGRVSEEHGGRVSHPKRSVSQQLDDVELQTVDFEKARFVGGEFVMDEEGGRMYILALNHDVLMHLLLLERQSLSFALQVMQQRSGCRRHVLRLLQHAFRLHTPLSDLSPALMLVNQRYRSAVETVPQEEVSFPGRSRAADFSPDSRGPLKYGGASRRDGSAASAAQPAGREAAGKSEAVGALGRRAGPGEATAAREGAKAREAESASGKGRKTDEGKTRVTVERLIAWVGDATIVTERDIVLSVLYPYVVETLDLPPGQLLLEAAFDLPAGTASSLSCALCRKISSSVLRPSSALSVPCGCPGKFCGAISRSHEGRAFVGWRRGTGSRSGSWESEEPSASPAPSAVGGERPETSSEDSGAFFISGVTACSSEIPYVLSAALEYMRLLLSQQVLPHRVLQTFIFDACVFFKRGDILRQLLQYHVLLDSPGMLKRLYLVWQQLRMRRRRCLACAKDERWTRQTCLDMALRQRDWGTIVEILIELKQYTRVVPLLQRYAVSYYPLRDFLRAVAADVEAQQTHPGLLQHILACVRAWVKEASVSASGLAIPNLTDCSLWLPRDLTAVAAPKQFPASLLQDFSEKHAPRSTSTTELPGEARASRWGGGESTEARGGGEQKRESFDGDGEQKHLQAGEAGETDEGNVEHGRDAREEGEKKGSGDEKVSRVEGEEPGKGDSDEGFGFEGDERRREALEHVDWEEIGEVSAAIVEGSEISDSEHSADAMFSFESHHHLVVTALGDPQYDEARNVHFSA
ncbi:hypothetical protein TGME49_310270 [Toxoplasma gondii ME49]|uniref:Mic1 domain-containing protein n=3 Tax=Toxoplasma gondii TaxID=5811 RepID=A0A125YTU6_TOXGV|nr:hypothetical protein TGME49_310270 [Toxoplasma gondii ME49]EPT26204.1 hypothetical protein TGME49_310270 [Toxoplasma gondii ME49]ESS34809.1 hypothetical protein TGVEG_310270 [Toxoplasma gondii VEG]|eukprot:XP_018635574.1 hypothetical protein TGME49_310270 [Toxoplasma gondii ME49]